MPFTPEPHLCAPFPFHLLSKTFAYPGCCNTAGTFFTTPISCAFCDIDINKRQLAAMVKQVEMVWREKVEMLLKLAAALFLLISA